MSIDKFCNYLQSNDFVVQKQIPYYVQWVTQFLHFCDAHSDQTSPGQQLNNYLSQIGKRYEKWQVKQAEEAISLYRFFIGRKIPSTDQKGHDWDTDWVKAAEMLRRMLRLKQLAYSTEKSYVAWLRKFYIYVRPLVPEELDSSHLKNFLSYLASERRVAKATQNQAFNALLFFYRHVLEKDVGSIADVVRSRRGRNCQRY